MTEVEIALAAMKLEDKECGVIIRIMNKRRVVDESSCWEFTGRLSDNGYGLIKYEGKRISVHRAFFRFLKPLEFKEDLLVCHRCNNKICFNLDHLYMGTALDNYNDSVKAGTSMLTSIHNSIKTFCPKGHEYTLENTRINLKTGNKQCFVCYREYQAQYRAEKQIDKLIVRLMNKK